MGKRNLWRWRVGAFFASAAAALVCARTSLADPQTLITTVSWTDGAGNRGTFTFEGTADGSSLTGAAHGGGSELFVSGSIASDGTVTGTLATPDGQNVGHFGGTLDASSQLVGGYAVIDGQGGQFTAPADALPVPAP
jgi:hypothetical protein